ncbi:MAG: ATP-binding cassette domain-containing protein [bacterium]|nr:ATP-binding cassette domain-containing protein [bacterium]
MSGSLRVTGAREHNLRGIDVEIPHGALTVVTGVSGSGKSSLAFDTLFREGQRRYLAALSSHARQFLGKLQRPAATAFEGLPPALAVDQRTTVRNPRSTVGTLTEVYDHLRLLFARIGTPPDPAIQLHLGSFSFNTKDGACENCKGLGVVDRVDPDLLIADPNRTLRAGALVPTTKSGYIVYSQVTVDVLDQICRAHGFDVDTPWQELSAEQREVIFHGSRRLKVPFGKHTLESRMKWSGITARPRDEGYYKGLVPTIAETLTRNRNQNVLRFVRSVPCGDCDGTRLNAIARTTTVADVTLPELLTLPLDRLATRLADLRSADPTVAAPLVAAISDRLDVLVELGLGHLELGRESTSLSGGEAQRIRLARQVGSGLHGLLYVLDEPSIGLHPAETDRLLHVLRRLRDLGNTVLCVEHDPDTIVAADHLIDLGPGAGRDGGELLFAGPRQDAAASPTWAWLVQNAAEPIDQAATGSAGPELTIRNATTNNLRGIDVTFHLGRFNVVTGVSGAGKSSLVEVTLARALRQHLHGARETPGAHAAIAGLEHVGKVIAIDAGPIGRTPRSNPATYTGALDGIRDLFAAQPAAKATQLKKSHFSMNVAGGRCEACQGAGHTVIGMHGLADVEILCPDCQGRRFREEVLAVEYRGHSIADALALPIASACELFADEPGIQTVLATLVELGLGYLHLGQSATTLSGGEAQRVKLAAELARPAGRAHVVYILDEPTTGLHGRDTATLLAALTGLVSQGHTVIVIEHDRDFVRRADHVIDLGPGAGVAGGEIVFAGPPAELARHRDSATGRALAEPSKLTLPPTTRPAPAVPSSMRWSGVRTNNLRDIDVTIPLRQLTVITGVSGSGKSSLAFDTIFAEGRRRYAENLTTQARRHLPTQHHARFDDVHGITPVVALRQRLGAPGQLSTVATLTDVHHYLRILFSRAGTPRGALTASAFSFHHPAGACPRCHGAGEELRCDPDKLITDPSRSLFDGAMDGTKTGRFYGERDGRYLATLTAAASQRGLDVTRPYAQLDDAARELAMFGSDDTEYDVTWRFKRGKRTGEHSFRGTFDGFARYVDEEYGRKRIDSRGDAIRPLLTARRCPECDGSRLQAPARTVTFADCTISAMCELSASAMLDWIAMARARLDPNTLAIAEQPLAEIERRVRLLVDLGVGHLALDRSARSLSGGELQRTRLATQLGTRMHGVTYVLDEPTTGLHPHDTDRLIELLQELRNEAGTVIVVEHDPRVWARADHVLVLGPGAGREGGTVVASGEPSQVPPPAIADLPVREAPAERLRVRGASRHNLREVDVELPLRSLIAISGVSGSGKSTLAHDVIAASLADGRPNHCGAVETDLPIAAVVVAGQHGIARSPLSTPITHLGLFDVIRGLFAKASGLPKAAFSLATKPKAGETGPLGRCENCQGHGAVRTDMDFLADVWHPCEVCEGQRFTPATLAARWRDHSIADVLTSTVTAGLELFDDDKRIAPALRALDRLGLGYLKLGQPGNTLSGGESQRIELARALVDDSAAGSLFVLDEPTTGLHPSDVARLLPVLRELAERGHTVIAVEHDPAVIRNADWVIDLGPGTGSAGGQVLYSGPPKGLRTVSSSVTARYL